MPGARVLPLLYRATHGVARPRVDRRGDPRGRCPAVGLDLPLARAMALRTQAGGIATVGRVGVGGGVSGTDCTSMGSTWSAAARCRSSPCARPAHCEWWLSRAGHAGEDAPSEDAEELDGLSTIQARSVEGRAALGRVRRIQRLGAGSTSCRLAGVRWCGDHQPAYGCSRAFGARRCAPARPPPRTTDILSDPRDPGRRAASVRAEEMERHERQRTWWSIAPLAMRWRHLDRRTGAADTEMSHRGEAPRASGPSPCRRRR